MGLLNFKISQVLPAKKWKVIRLFTRLDELARFVPHIKSSKALEEKNGAVVRQWAIEIEKIPVSWKEEEILEIENFRFLFKAVEGDMEVFEGAWQLKDHESGGTEIEITAQISLGIPMLEQIMGGVVERAIRRHFESMIDAMRERLTMNRYKNIADREVSDLKGFGVIGHPYNLQHLIRYFKFFKPDFKIPSDPFLSKLFELTPSYKAYDVPKFSSLTGKETSGYFIMCPIVPDMLQMSLDKVVEKVRQACRVAEELGVGIVTLGGFTSIAGEKMGKVLAESVNIPVTTGNTFTVALVLEGVRKAARLVDIELSKAKVTIIGGTGDIGGACAKILTEEAAEITITGRNERNLMEMERVLSYIGKAKVHTSTNNNEAVRHADIIIAAASASSSIVDVNNVKSGAVVCDVGYPKNISYTACSRKDILIFSGGISKVPTEFNLGFDIGMPVSSVLYGCFAEAIVLDLEERYENFSFGKGNITKEKVNQILAMGSKHGFTLAPFFWGNRLLPDEEVEKIRHHVHG